MSSRQQPTSGWFACLHEGKWEEPLTIFAPRRRQCDANGYDRWKPYQQPSTCECKARRAAAASIFQLSTEKVRGEGRISHACALVLNARRRQLSAPLTLLTFETADACGTSSGSRRVWRRRLESIMRLSNDPRVVSVVEMLDFGVARLGKR